MQGLCESFHPNLRQLITPYIANEPYGVLMFVLFQWGLWTSDTIKLWEEPGVRAEEKGVKMLGDGLDVQETEDGNIRMREG